MPATAGVRFRGTIRAAGLGPGHTGWPAGSENVRGPSEYFAAWNQDATWRRINAALRRQVRMPAGRGQTPPTTSTDSQSVKATETANSGGYDGAKKTTGRRRHIVVDCLVLLLAI